MYLVGWVDVRAQTTTGISIPCLLSFLAYGSFDATVTGLDSFPPDVWAPINLVFQVYHIMINLGFILSRSGCWAPSSSSGSAASGRRAGCCGSSSLSIFLTELATQSGWWTAEFGRQPWIVWNLLRTADAVSPVLETYQVAASVLMFVVLYALLFVLFIYLLNEKIQHGPDPLDDEVPVLVAARLPSRTSSAAGRAPRDEVKSCGSISSGMCFSS